MYIRPLHPRQQPYEPSGYESGHEHTRCGECYPRHYHRTYGRDFCAHASREQYDAECHHAYALCCVHVAELYARSVCPESHPHKQEDEKDGQTYPVA